MKVWSWVALAGAMLGGGWYTAHQIAASAFPDTRVFITCDSIFSPELIQKIQTIGKKTFSAHHVHRWMHAMQKQFSLIDHITCTSGDYAITEIFVKAKKVRFTANDAWVFDSDGNHHPVTMLGEETRCELPRVYVRDSLGVRNGVFKSFADKVDDTLLRRYHTAWYSPYEVEFTDVNGKYRVIASYDTLPDDDIVRKVEHLVAHADRRRGVPIADIRFSDQIVMYLRDGGLKGEHGDVEFFRTNNSSH